MRKFLLIVFGLAALCVVSEVVSSYVLYNHFWRVHSPFQPAHSATLDLLTRIFHKPKVVLSVDGPKPFVLDPDLGFVPQPGLYRITEQEGELRRVFDMTIDAAGNRATSYGGNKAPRRVFIAGDSSFFGLGINDESTVAWLLQARFPACQVINLSGSSYSYVHALLRLEKIKPAISEDDIVILPYHPISNEFNAGMRSILSPLVGGFEMQLGSPDIAHMQYPYGALNAAGGLEFRRTPLPYPGQATATPESMDTSAVLGQQITIAAIAKLRSDIPAHLFMGILRGEPSDPVFTYIKDHGIDYIDLRHADQFGADDLSRIDGHPGPSWHHYAFLEIAGALVDKHMCEQQR